MKVPIYSSPSEILHILDHVELFSGIGVPQQKMLADHLVKIEKNADEIVIEQDDLADRLYIITKGSVIVSIKKDSRGWIRINKLGPGDVFGEIAILRNIRRTARVTTESACTLLTINSQEFLEIYQYFPPQARDNIQIVIAKRLASHRLF